MTVSIDESALTVSDGSLVLRSSLDEPENLIARALELMGLPPHTLDHALPIGSALDGLLRALPPTAVRALARRLGVHVSALCAVTGLSMRTLNRRQVLRPVEGSRVYRVAIVAAEACAAFPNIREAQTWVGAPHPPPLYPTPLAQLDTEPGLALVRAHLEAIRRAVDVASSHPPHSTLPLNSRGRHP